MEIIIASPAGEEKNSVERTCFLNQERVSENQPAMPVFFFFEDAEDEDPLRAVGEELPEDVLCED